MLVGIAYIPNLCAWKETWLQQIQTKSQLLAL